MNNVKKSKTPNPAQIIPKASSANGSIGISNDYARADHIHPTNASTISNNDIDIDICLNDDINILDEKSIFFDISAKNTQNSVYFKNIKITSTFDSQVELLDIYKSPHSINTDFTFNKIAYGPTCAILYNNRKSSSTSETSPVYNYVGVLNYNTPYKYKKLHIYHFSPSASYGIIDYLYIKYINNKFVYLRVHYYESKNIHYFAIYIYHINENCDYIIDYTQNGIYANSNNDNNLYRIRCIYFIYDTPYIECSASSQYGYIVSETNTLEKVQIKIYENGEFKNYKNFYINDNMLFEYNDITYIINTSGSDLYIYKINKDDITSWDLYASYSLNAVVNTLYAQYNNYILLSLSTTTIYGNICIIDIENNMSYSASYADIFNNNNNQLLKYNTTSDNFNHIYMFQNAEINTFILKTEYGIYTSKDLGSTNKFLYNPKNNFSTLIFPEFIINNLIYTPNSYIKYTLENKTSDSLDINENDQYFSFEKTDKFCLTTSGGSPISDILYQNNHIIVFKSSGTVYYIQKNNNTYNCLTIGNSAHLTDKNILYFNSSNVLYINENYSLEYKIPTNIPSNLNTIYAFTRFNNFYIISDGRYFYKSEDLTDWNNCPCSTFNNAYIQNNDINFISNGNTIILYTHTYGGSWTTQDIDYEQYFSRYIISKDNGNTWTVKNLKNITYTNNIFMFSTNNKFIIFECINNVNYYYQSEDGENWTIIKINKPLNLSSCSGYQYIEKYGLHILGGIYISYDFINWFEINPKLPYNLGLNDISTSTPYVIYLDGTFGILCAGKYLAVGLDLIFEDITHETVGMNIMSFDSATEMTVTVEAQNSLGETKTVSKTVNII